MKLRKTQVQLKDCEGKTILGVAGCLDERAIVFTDGTFVHLGVKRGYDGDASVEDQDYEYGESDVADDYLIRLGLFTKEDIAQHNAEREQRRRAYDETKERQQYERLKAKFGNA